MCVTLHCAREGLLKAILYAELQMTCFSSEKTRRILEKIVDIAFENKGMKVNLGKTRLMLSD